MIGFLRGCRRLHQMRLSDRLEHDERLEALLSQLENRHPAAVDPSALHDAAQLAERRYPMLLHQHQTRACFLH